MSSANMNTQSAIPTLAEAQVRHVRARLQSVLAAQDGPLVLACTGKTHSGKSRLGNLFSGLDILPSDGQMDCTSDVHLVNFPCGVVYADLPGVASDDRFENFNRAALGIEQVADWPTAERVRLIGHNANQNNADELREPLKPDVIFYMVAPNHLFLSSEAGYLKALLRVHPADRIVYVLNLFGSKESDSTFTTDGNIADAIKKIRDIHRNAVGEGADPHIVTVNCWTGHGILNLLNVTLRAVPESKTPGVQHLLAEADQPSRNFLGALKAAILPILCEVARMNPQDFGSGVPLESQLQALRGHIVHALGLPSALDLSDLIKELSAQLVRMGKQCTSVRHEPVYRTVRDRDEVPVYGYKSVDDLDRPIKQTVYRDPSDPFEFVEGLWNMLDKNKFGVPQEKIIGYHQKQEYTVVRYRTEYSTREEATGQTRTITENRCFGKDAVAIFAAAAELFVKAGTQTLRRENWGPVFRDAANRLAGWPWPNATTLDANAVAGWLTANVNTVLGTGFDTPIRSLWFTTGDVTKPALIKCPECSEQVSDRARACPNCGFPMRDAKPMPAPIKCPECSQQVSDRAMACSNCGFPLRAA